jgi:hypothetical protein
MFFAGSLISLERRNLLRINVLGHLIRLPLLECEPQAFMAVVFIICLVLVVLDADEVAVHGLRVQGKSHKCIDSGSFGNDFEGPRLQI